MTVPKANLIVKPFLKPNLIVVSFLKVQLFFKASIILICPHLSQEASSTCNPSCDYFCLLGLQPPTPF